MQEDEEFFEPVQFPLLVAWLVPRGQGKNSIAHTHASIFVSMQQSKVFLWTHFIWLWNFFFPCYMHSCFAKCCAQSHTQVFGWEVVGKTRIVWRNVTEIQTCTVSGHQTQSAELKRQLSLSQTFCTPSPCQVNEKINKIHTLGYQRELHHAQMDLFKVSQSTAWLTAELKPAPFVLAYIFHCDHVQKSKLQREKHCKVWL